MTIDLFMYHYSYNRLNHSYKQIQITCHYQFASKLSQISFILVRSIYLVITKPFTILVIAQFFLFEKINIIESKSSFPSSFSYYPQLCTILSHISHHYLIDHHHMHFLLSITLHTMHIPSTKKKCQFQKYFSLDYSQSPLIFLTNHLKLPFNRRIFMNLI